MKIIYWLLPLLLHSTDANAWGLVTHVYFAQWLVWATPLLDPRLRQAVQRFPELVMAGACLPDLALVSPSFRHTHQWSVSREILLAANTDEELAIGMGYASHLFVDVVAHNHFVPAHEAMWLEQTLFTHISSEWAMDAHLAAKTSVLPYALLRKHRASLVPFMAQRFRCGEKRALQAVNRLAAADQLLRTFRLPQILYRLFRQLDQRVFNHFVYYISQTRAMLPQMEHLLAGTQPVWEADMPPLDVGLLSAWRQRCLDHLQSRHPSPIEHYVAAVHSYRPEYKVQHQIMNEMLAMTTPIMAPTTTSVG